MYNGRDQGFSRHLVSLMTFSRGIVLCMKTHVIRSSAYLALSLVTVHTSVQYSTIT